MPPFQGNLQLLSALLARRASALAAETRTLAAAAPEGADTDYSQ